MSGIDRSERGRSSSPPGQYIDFSLLVVGRMPERIANQRYDFAHQICHDLVKKNDRFGRSEHQWCEPQPQLS